MNIIIHNIAVCKHAYVHIASLSETVSRLLIISIVNRENRLIYL